MNVQLLKSTDRMKCGSPLKANRKTYFSTSQREKSESFQHRNAAHALWMIAYLHRAELEIVT